MIIEFIPLHEFLWTIYFYYYIIINDKKCMIQKYRHCKYLSMRSTEVVVRRARRQARDTMVIYMDFCLTPKIIWIFTKFIISYFSFYPISPSGRRSAIHVLTFSMNELSWNLQTFCAWFVTSHWFCLDCKNVRVYKECVVIVYFPELASGCDFFGISNPESLSRTL